MDLGGETYDLYEMWHELRGYREVLLKLRSASDADSDPEPDTALRAAADPAGAAAFYAADPAGAAAFYAADSAGTAAAAIPGSADAAADTECFVLRYSAGEEK